MTTEAALSQNDLERIERVIYKNGDDLAVSVSRSFERLEERIDAAESRLYSRIGELVDGLETHQERLLDELASLQRELNGLPAHD